MKKILIKKIYGFLVLGLLSIPFPSLMAASPPALTPNQTAAVMGIITNFILDDEVATLYHNGTAYGTVTSPYTERVWLDRNLGASQVCTASDDVNCYGDYYQWGRGADGHEKQTSPVTSISASQVAPVQTTVIGKFIRANYNLAEWTQENLDYYGVLRNLEWSKTDGTSICPIDFRVPSIQELRAETIDASIKVVNHVTAYSNFLKLPSNGSRLTTGYVNTSGTPGYIWSNSISDSLSIYLHYYWGEAKEHLGARAAGISVRCVKD